MHISAVSPISACLQYSALSLTSTAETIYTVLAETLSSVGMHQQVDSQNTASSVHNLAPKSLLSSTNWVKSLANSLRLTILKCTRQLKKKPSLLFKHGQHPASGPNTEMN